MLKNILKKENILLIESLGIFLINFISFILKQKKVRKKVCKQICV